MSDTNELEKTIEELEAEVLAELDEAKTKQPNDSGLKSEPGSKVEGERQDMGPAVVKPDAKSDPGKAATSKAKEVKGDAQQKNEKPAEKPKVQGSASKLSTPGDKEKLAAGDEVDHDGEDLAETPKSKEDHLAIFSGMKESELKSMLDAYKSSLTEDDDEDDEEEEDEDEVAEKKAKSESFIKDIDVGKDVEALVNDEDDLSEDFKKKAATIFEAAVKSQVRVESDRIIDEVTAEKKRDIEAFKSELTEKVDTYLNYVVEEWTKENELAIERGLKGEIAEDFISGLQQLFTDHYIDVPDEKYDVLEAQSDKISELEEKVNSEMQKNIDLKESNDGYMRDQVISEVSDDLADTEVEKFKSLTTDVDFVDVDNFRQKLETLKESYFPKVAVDNKDVTNDEDDSVQDVNTTKAMETYMSAISRNTVRAS